jgi:hypothetical protein
LARGDGYLKVVGIGGTLRENSTSAGGLVVDLAQKIGADEILGAVA